MFVLFFLLWVVFNGRLTLEIALIGAVLSVLLYAFICKFMGYRPRYDRVMRQKLGGMAKYAGRLLRDIFIANFQVLRLILSPKYEAEPRLVAFRTKLRTDGMRALLANSITLTPGTITASVEGDRLTVHCLDTQMAEGIKDSDMERALIALEGEEQEQ